MNRILATLAMTTAIATSALAAEGTVKKVNPKTMQVTIKHGPLPELDMPGMTMVFAVKDASQLPKLKAGKKINFTAGRVNGRITVMSVQ